ncbi:MAG: PglZ domain-containing protein, partial [Thermoguttaceae bacterium]
MVIVGASAFFGTDLFEVSQPLAALELAFHQQEKWEALRELFNPAEIEVIQKRLQAMPQPIGDLFGPNEENARLALAALVILRQHFEEPGRHLPVLSPSLAQYQDCTVGLCTEAASWFVEEEVPRFEKLIGETFRKHLHTTLQLNNEEQARAFAQRERFSSKLRALTPFAIKADKKSARLDGKQDFSLDRLVPEFQEVKRRLLDLLNITKPLIERLNLTALRDQSIAKVLDIFDKRGFYQLDQIVGRLNGLIRDVEGPAQRQWKTVSGFEDVWVKEVRECRDAMSTASRLRNDLDYLFGRLLEARYGELVPGEFLTTDQFYEQWMGPRRRGAQGEVRKAVVLIIDSMRLDIWRQLVQPALEREYAVEEVLGLARLPSETHVSRRAFFAGKPPAQVPMAGKESDLLADQLSRFHAATITLETVRIQRPGLVFGVQTKDKATYAGV